MEASAFLTAAGLAALRRPVRDRRAMDPARFAHLRRELGLDAAGGEDGGPIELRPSPGPTAAILILIDAQFSS